MIVGIDTGGTFTDLVAFDEVSGERRIVKVSSTPGAPAAAVGAALDELGAAEQVSRLVVGTTIVINAVLQRKGADAVFLTTAGFEDVAHIQRINRPTLYDLQWNKGEPLAKRANTVGVVERIDARGQVVQPLETAELERVLDQVAKVVEGMSNPAIAVCLLFSFRNSAHEARLAEALEARFPTIPVSISSRICPVWREYERSSTTIADAYVRPIIADFVRDLQQVQARIHPDSPVSLMKSNGGQIPLRTATSHSAQLLLSGLAGGLLAGKYYADVLERPSLITLDMGGTSADVGVIRQKQISFRDSYDIEWAIPIVGSFVDMTTIGAGGSSIASFDRGGLLRVGPDSAGADPGPAAYGFGGTEATVTDANVVLGRLDPDYFLGGKMQLDATRSAEAVAVIAERLGNSLEEAALAIVRMANENMANAIRLVTVDRGLDYREFDLLAFGGAGSLHAADVAATLGMRRVVVPLHPGLASAFGLIAATPRVDRSRTCSFDSETGLGGELSAEFVRLVHEVERDLAEDGYDDEVEILRSVNMRYLGQNYEQEIAVPDGPIDDSTIPELVIRFHSSHQSTYGYSMPDNPCELAQLNVVALGSGQRPSLPALPASDRAHGPRAERPVFFEGHDWLDSEIYLRQDLAPGSELRGPAVIAELDSTTLVHPNQTLSIDEHGLLHLEVVGVTRQQPAETT